MEIKELSDYIINLDNSDHNIIDKRVAEKGIEEYLNQQLIYLDCSRILKGMRMMQTIGYPYQREISSYLYAVEMHAVHKHKINFLNVIKLILNTKKKILLFGMVVRKLKINGIKNTVSTPVERNLLMVLSLVWAKKLVIRNDLKNLILILVVLHLKLNLLRKIKLCFVINIKLNLVILFFVKNVKIILKLVLVIIMNVKN